MIAEVDGLETNFLQGFWLTLDELVEFLLKTRRDRVCRGFVVDLKNQFVEQDIFKTTERMRGQDKSIPVLLSAAVSKRWRRE